MVTTSVIPEIKNVTRSMPLSDSVRIESYLTIVTMGNVSEHVYAFVNKSVRDEFTEKLNEFVKNKKEDCKLIFTKKEVSLINKLEKKEQTMSYREFYLKDLDI